MHVTISWASNRLEGRTREATREAGGGCGDMQDGAAMELTNNFVSQKVFITSFCRS